MHRSLSIEGPLIWRYFINPTQAATCFRSLLLRPDLSVLRGAPPGMHSPGHCTSEFAICRHHHEGSLCHGPYHLTLCFTRPSCHCSSSPPSWRACPLINRHCSFLLSFHSSQYLWLVAVCCPLLHCYLVLGHLQLFFAHAYLPWPTGLFPLPLVLLIGLSVLASELCQHPCPAFCHYFISDFEHGFTVGFQPS